MRLLQYKDLDLRRVKPAFEKVRAAIEADDFRSADVKKLHAGPYFRAKLDYANRLLLQFARVQDAGGQTRTVCLALEVIENHAYDRSRFLRGATVDEAKIEREPAAKADDGALAAEDTTLRWLHPTRMHFELLDKPIVFDDAQDEAWRQMPPLVLIGAAGSGKTAVTLSKLRGASGRVLYVTLSAYLAQSARTLYAAHGYDNVHQEVEFLSYRELLETLHVPPGREVTLADFAGWSARHRQAMRELGEVDAHALFEEFRGVIGAQPSGPMDRETYLSLGPRQSLLQPDQREAAYALFQRYRAWLAEAGFYDANLVAYQWRTELAGQGDPPYDFVVVDEVQDMTPVQLALVLALLKKPGHFMLCGDSHQIVHPNFFSWSQVKTMFWQGVAGETKGQPLQVLQANFRNTRRVTEIANRLLRIKQARFGSVDRESSFLVGSASAVEGRVDLLEAKDSTIKALDEATRQSARHAIIVLREEDKPRAKEQFRSPLVFSVHEAKGLEYPHVVLFDLVSGQRQAYAQVCEGVEAGALEGDELLYRRARDKTDKSLELYKFYVNALYVSMTRAVETLTVVEHDTGHPLLDLLGLQAGEAAPHPVRASTQEEWAQEARRLELQGKAEQAQAIREGILQHKPVPWTPWSRELVEQLAPKALDPKQPSTKPRQTVFEYALWHGQHAWVERLAGVNFQPARQLVDEGSFTGAGTRSPNRVRILAWERQQELTRRTVASIRQRHLQTWSARTFKDLLRQADVHGVDHRTVAGATPLMMAARAGNVPLVEALLQRGADAGKRDEFGHEPWLHCVNRAIEEPGFAKTALPQLFELLAPGAIDVQTGGRLARIERHHGEYWVLTLMLAGLKSQWSRCIQRSVELYRYDSGFFADQLHEVLEPLPAWLWPDRRRKRGYLNHVLSRAERDSDYRPARQLWVRSRHGHYLPNPEMLLRDGEGWRPVYEVMGLDWIDNGCGSADDDGPRPAQRIGWLAGASEPEVEMSDPPSGSCAP